MSPLPPRPRPPRSAQLAFACAFAILAALGFWQLHRLHWKQGILAAIDRAEQAPAVPLRAGTPPLFTRVVAHGTWRAGSVALYGAEVRGDRMGATAVQLLDGSAAGRPLVVVLGWVPTEHAAIKPMRGPADITGYVRLPETPNFLSAQDDAEGRHFYTLDPAAIGAALGAPQAAPFTLVSLGLPGGATALPRPVNNHLNYALTWFGLAASLLAVFVAWSRRPGEAEEGLLF